MKPLIQKALDVAATQIGVREVPLNSNKGPQVDQYLASVGLGPGYSWCAAFVNWCIVQAAKSLSVSPCWLASASCSVLSHWAGEHGILVDQPQAGDVFLYYEAGAAHHTGFVTGIKGGRYATIEGNTNIDGSSNGIGVFQRSRPLGSVYKFIRWENLLPPSPLEPAWKVYLMQPPAHGIALNGPNQKLITPVQFIDGHVFVGVRGWGEALGFQVEWDNEHQAVLFDGHAVAAPITNIDGLGYAAVRALADAGGLQLNVDSSHYLIFVHRPNDHPPILLA